MFDLDKIKASAEEIGIKFQENSSNPGLHFKSSDGRVNTSSYNEIMETASKFFPVCQNKTNGFISTEIKSFNVELKYDHMNSSSFGPMSLKLKLGEGTEETSTAEFLKTLDSSGYDLYDNPENDKAA